MTVSLPTTALLPMPSTEPVVCKCGSKEGQNWYPFATALLGAVAGLLGVVAAGISCFVAARYTYPAAKISLKLAEDQKKEGDKGKEPATGGGDT
ncbi:hypothetical protein N7474_002753 [Penicillium riverlandense]|uniref:uncharacterized protein n=1 Tax=Penicillium riverlandense TaxID=1903569 RepID=UPI002549899E|nr:uncharacterized protein N7474_002753 [Penicillium riverlandense]KAJ5825615.1 hypothetical protein N7474_002753 [Penicillium riverlandense]